MAKARAIVKRRKAVRNIRKITKTMQMIATAKFQKSLRRAVGSKPYSQKVRELVRELAASVGNVEHPLLRRPSAADRTRRVGLAVITSNRGLAGAYNGNVLRAAIAFIRQQEAAGNTVDLYVTGKKGVTYYNYQRRTVTQRVDVSDNPRFAEVEPLADHFIAEFTAGRLDAVYVAYMNFISAGVQKPEIVSLLPLAGVEGAPAGQGGAAHGGAATGGASQSSGAQGGTTHGAGAAQGAGAGRHSAGRHATPQRAIYEFSPSPEELLNELLPLTVRTALFQAYLDATTSEHVARMVAMKSATDNADKMVKALSMEYNRARQSQITTELAEIMGGVESMKA